jgi:hypothetical protein
VPQQREIPHLTVMRGRAFTVFAVYTVCAVLVRFQQRRAARGGEVWDARIDQRIVPLE